MSSNEFSKASTSTQAHYEKFNAFIETLNLSEDALDIINDYAQVFYLCGKVDKYFEDIQPEE